MNAEDVLTVGIDIGTSTTKVVFSILKVANTAGQSRMPRMEIVDRHVFYRGPLTRTPLHSERMIEMEGVWRIIAGEYTAAGVRMQDVQTGAVIITGETATKANAREVLSTLAERSGDFVVAAAGPDLEGILAGKGSGAQEWSRKTGQVTANVDIGGGTANIAVFAHGKVTGTCTLHIGGRMLCFLAGKISRISEHLRNWSQVVGCQIEIGSEARAEAKSMGTFAYGMAEVIANVLHNRVGSLERVLLLGHRPNWSESVQTIMFSGGVGGLLELLEKRPYETQFEDLVVQQSVAQDGFADAGMMMAYAILHSTALSHFHRVPATETMRATVIGVGTQSVEISGATVHVDRRLLPLQNLPIVSCDLTSPANAETDIAMALERARLIHDPAGEGVTFALSLMGMKGWGFSQLRALANSVRRVWNARDPDQLVVVVMDSDVGKAFGQSLVAVGMKNAICVDQIQVEHGDYIDIGAPLESTEAVPVLVKTLVLDAARKEVVQ